MKVILIFSFCLMIFGCNKAEDKSFTVSGIANNSEILIIKLNTSDSTYVDTLKNGAFSFRIHTTCEKYIDLELGNKISLYVKPDDSLFINYNDYSNFDLSGTGFEESEFLFNKRALIKELGFDDPRKIDIALFSSEPNAFRKKIDSIQQIRIKQVTDFKVQHPGLSDLFYNIEKELIDYIGINQLFKYPEFHETLTNNKPRLPDNYFGFTERIEPNKRELYSFIEYKSAITSFLDMQSETINEKYNLTKKILRDKDFFDEIMFSEFHNYINFNGTNNIDSIFTEFIENLGDSEREKSLQDKYKAWAKLAKGEKAPEFEIKDNCGKLVRLSDFKGKYIYINCWSTFCGPCIAEMPAMKKLSEEFKNENIFFISISADQDIDRWLSKVKEFNLNTINLCTEGSRHKFNNDYNAKAFPRYILIDDKGLIIDATADKPSEIKEMLEQLL